MYLKAGALALALLLASRVLGLVRESALAAAFGASALADVAVLMLTLPDWVAGLLASGALAYVLVPAWAGQEPAQVRVTQRRVAVRLLAGGFLLSSFIVLVRRPLVAWLAPGLPPDLELYAAAGLVWSALALPAALLAALWVTRLQHEGDASGMYGANLVVNAVLIGGIACAARMAGATAAVGWLGLALIAAMGLRLAWLAWRQVPYRVAPTRSLATVDALPGTRVWLWAALGAGLPLALPFVARSIASQTGAGALATFNYAWKLVELPLVLVIQLVAALAFPAIARAYAGGTRSNQGMPLTVRTAFALGWTLACAAAAGLLVGAPALARLLFGWGTMTPQAVDQLALWARAAAWGLLPQSLTAIALTVLAVQSRLRVAVIAHALALVVLLLAAANPMDGLALMHLLNALFTGIALVALAALGRPVWAGLPWRTVGCSFAVLLLVAFASAAAGDRLRSAGIAGQLAAAGAAALLLAALTWLASPSMRQALKR